MLWNAWVRVARAWTNLPLRIKGLAVISIPLVFLIALTLAFKIAEREAKHAEESVRHTLEVINQLQSVHTRMEEAETGMRGYLLTGLKDWRAPYDDARRSLPAALDRLESSVSDNPSQLERVRRIKSLAVKQLQVLAALPNARAAADGGSESYQDLIGAKGALDEARAELAYARSEQEKVLAQRLQRQRSAWSRTSTLVSTGFLFVPAAGILAMLLFTTGIVRRVQRLDADAHRLASGLAIPPGASGSDEIGRLEASLREAGSLLADREADLRTARDELEIRVRDRTAELAEAVEALQEEVTERTSAEERHRQTSDTLRAVIEATPLAIIGLSLDGRVVGWNKAAQEMFGWTEQEVIGKPLPTVPEDGMEEFRQLMESAKRGEIVAGVEKRRKRKDGKMIDTRLWTAPLRDSTGEITGKIAVLTDFTERKSLEQQFAQAQKMEAIGRLAGGVAHDFNNLITIIAGYGQMLLEGVRRNPDLRESAEEILKAAERSAALTSQLLAFSRRQVIQPRVLEVNGLVRNFEKMLRRVIGEDLELRTLLKPDAGLVKADPGQIEQVLMNLAINARDAMPGGGLLTLETGSAELDGTATAGNGGAKPGRYSMLAVTDTGQGMDAATRQRLFEPFFTTKETGKGTGLGLSTVYGIVKQHGGDIWVYSEPGKGSVFKIYLPQVTTSGTSVEPEMATMQPRKGTETILVVEDEEGVRKLIGDLLEREGYKVILAESGHEALEISRRHTGQIHLLLTDVIMPRMSGRELATTLLNSTPGLKVLFLSGYTDTVIVEHGVLNTESHFLQKPFTPNTLSRKVREVLDARSSAGN